MSDKEPADLAELDARLKAARAPDEGVDPSLNWEQNALGFGFRISIELVVGIMVGLALGWSTDRWLGTKPLFMLVLMFLGLAAGVLNVMRAIKEQERRAERRQQEHPGGSD